MTSTKKATRINIVAEVWDRNGLASALEAGTNPEPITRHRSVEAAQRMAQYFQRRPLNLHAGATYVVYARVPGSSHTFVELVSWKAGVKTTGDPAWVYNGQRFAGRLEAAAAASDIRSRWLAVTDTVVAPSNEPVNYRWDDDLFKAVPLEVPKQVAEVIALMFPWCESCQSYHHPANPTCKLVQPVILETTLDPYAVEQALRAAGVRVESPEDPTEATRRVLQHRNNTEAPADGTREYWEAKYGAGNVWSTQEVGQAFEIIQFAAPYVLARRRADGVEGLLQFAHSPRFYFDFQPEVL